MDKRNAFEIVNNYINYLKNNRFSVVNAYIFGSYANGKNTEDSDIDLAIIMNNIEDSIDMQVQLMMLRRNYETIIEPHPFDVSEFNNEHPFADEIIKTGIKII
ncbi:MAG: nucleotidyltransferase domain-containing protein [Bacteroidia bacterium]|nr:nucleotidyltransferase domain-containing protein [Bacteroidia bacterium]